MQKSDTELKADYIAKYGITYIPRGVSALPPGESGSTKQWSQRWRAQRKAAARQRERRYREMFEAGLSARRIAYEMGVKVGTVHKVRSELGIKAR